MFAATVAFVKAPVRRICQVCGGMPASDCLGDFLHLRFGCRNLACRPFAKVRILSRIRLESAG